jgi:hypothetical protein
VHHQDAQEQRIASDDVERQDVGETRRANVDVPDARAAMAGSRAAVRVSSTPMPPDTRRTK